MSGHFIRTHPCGTDVDVLDVVDLVVDDVVVCVDDDVDDADVEDDSDVEVFDVAYTVVVLVVEAVDSCPNPTVAFAGCCWNIARFFGAANRLYDNIDIISSITIIASTAGELESLTLFSIICTRSLASSRPISP